MCYAPRTMGNASRTATTRLLHLAVHELRTPASVVSGYLRMLLAGHAGPLNERQQKMLSEADRSNRRLNDLIADLGTLSNLESGALTLAVQRVPLWTLVREVTAAVDEGRDRGVLFEARTSGDEVEVLADATRLRTALGALLTATARERVTPATCLVDGRLETRDGGGPQAVIRIGEEPALAGLDGPPGRFDDWRGGLGLALPLARHVVEGAGGRLWAPRGRANRAAIGVALPVAPSR
ncbi:MAG: hypothetical protein KGN76_03155 [Acidobacteriota bacterium]|nr:hypothetical protein [Acidobacteriota bacterium]